MTQKPKCLQRKVIATTSLFAIEQLELQFANGNERVFERIVHENQGAVMIAAIHNNALLLVREYAAGIDDYELALPKGRIDKGEACIDAANRELREEVGFAAHNIKHIRSMTLAPGYFGARLELMLAQDLYESKLAGDEPEPLEVVAWPLDNWQELLKRPDFTEARSIAALFLIKDYLNNNKEKP